MFLINNYDYLFKKPEIKTLLYANNIVELSLFNEKLYQFGKAPHSIFFVKSQMEDFLLAGSFLVLSDVFSCWELYLKDIRRLLILWKTYQCYFLADNFSCLSKNFELFTPFSYFFFSKKRIKKNKLVRALIIELNSSFKFPVTTLIQKLKRTNFKYSVIYPKLIIKKRVMIPFFIYVQRFQYWWNNTKIIKRKRKREKKLSRLYKFIFLFLIQQKWIQERFLALTGEKHKSIQRIWSVHTSVLHGLYYYNNNNVTNLLQYVSSYNFFIFPRSFWQFFKKVKNRVQQYNMFFLSYSGELNADDGVFEELFFYWFFIVSTFLVRDTQINFYLKWGFFKIRYKYLHFRSSRYYFWRKSKKYNKKLIKVK